MYALTNFRQTLENNCKLQLFTLCLFLPVVTAVKLLAYHTYSISVLAYMSENNKCQRYV